MAIVCIVLMAALLAFSETAMAAARTALSCFGTGVLPALLPMMVLGRMIPSHPKTERSGKRLWLSSALFGFAAGSPASAQRAAAVRGRMSPVSWERLLCISGVMSPMFFTGTLAGWLGSARDGRVLLGLHWLGAAITVCLWPSAGADVTEALPADEKTEEQIRLPNVISQSAQALLCVCGAMMTFSIAASLLKSLFSIIFPLWTAQHAKELAILWGLMEIGGGSFAVIGVMDAPHAVISALCGFGGLSIWLQNMLFLDEKIRPAKLLLMRALHGAVCYGLVKLIRPF